MSDLDRLEQYREELSKEISEKELVEGEYCILVSVGKVPKFGYKNVAHFMSRVLKDVYSVDPMFSVEFCMIVFES